MCFTPPRGVWSATPTPLNDDFSLDFSSIPALIEHHLRLGVKGLFLGGTCGEGPWLARRDLAAFVREVVRVNEGRLVLAVQVSDNSSARVMENMEMVAEANADIAVIAPPNFLLNATPDNLLNHYLRSIAQSPLPVGIYDRGSNGAVVVPDEILPEIYGQEKVVMVKDSSSNDQRRDIALAAREKRPSLLLLNGDEFRCDDYLRAGYDGLLLGGGIFNGFLANRIAEAVSTGRYDEAEKLQKRMNEMMFEVFGGPQITCWLTGQKELLVRLGVFKTNKNFLNYPLNTSCSAAIDAVLSREKDILLP